MARNKKWINDSDRSQACRLRKTINPSTKKLYTNFEIMTKFGYFLKGGFKNTDRVNVNFNVNKLGRNARIPPSSIGQLEKEPPILLKNLTTDTLIEESLRLHNEEQSTATLKVLVDIWKVKQNVIDEANFDNEIDLTEIYDYANSEYKSKKESNAIIKDTV